MVYYTAVGAGNLGKSKKNMSTACRLENMHCFLYQSEMAGLHCVITFTTTKSVLTQMNILQESVGGNVSQEILRK